MSNNKMSFNTANEIVDVYSKFLENQTYLDFDKKYSYSDVQNFDLIDFSNAIKLLIAYKIFIKKSNDENFIEHIKKFTKLGSSALASVHGIFHLDHYKFDFNHIDSKDETAISNSIETTINSLSDNEQLFWKQETPTSFFDYCLQIESDPDFWIKVYNRIGITWETNDKYDRIYVHIAPKNSSQNSNKKDLEIIQDKSSLGIIKTIKNFFKSIISK